MAYLGTIQTHLNQGLAVRGVTVRVDKGEGKTQTVSHVENHEGLGDIAFLEGSDLPYRPNELIVVD
jgi:hypothetical protein